MGKKTGAVSTIPFKSADIQALVPKSKNPRLSGFIDINQSILVTVLWLKFPGWGMMDEKKKKKKTKLKITMVENKKFFFIVSFLLTWIMVIINNKLWFSAILGILNGKTVAFGSQSNRKIFHWYREDLRTFWPPNSSEERWKKKRLQCHGRPNCWWNIQHQLTIFELFNYFYLLSSE